MPAGSLDAVSRELLAELAPVARRAVTLDPAALARIRFGPGSVSILALLPFDVLVARTITAPAPESDDAAAVDVTVRADEFLAWLDGERTTAPAARDDQWRTGLPPERGWRRVETVPDEAIRAVVRQGAIALKDAGQGSTYGAATQAMTDAMLDSVVLTATKPDELALRADVALRTLTALTRMGFLARDSYAHVDVCGRWTRVAAAYGTVYAASAGLTLAPA
jgi:hypothetical protein